MTRTQFTRWSAGALLFSLGALAGNLPTLLPARAQQGSEKPSQTPENEEFFRRLREELEVLEAYRDSIQAEVRSAEAYIEETKIVQQTAKTMSDRGYSGPTYLAAATYTLREAETCLARRNATLKEFNVRIAQAQRRLKNPELPSGSLSGPLSLEYRVLQLEQELDRLQWQQNFQKINMKR